MHHDVMHLEACIILRAYGCLHCSHMLLQTLKSSNESENLERKHTIRKLHNMWAATQTEQPIPVATSQNSMTVHVVGPAVFLIVLLQVFSHMGWYICRAELDGGGVLLTSNDATVTRMNACNITSKSAGSDGGGLRVMGGATMLTNSTFVNNSAGGRGGAMMYTQQCFLPGMSALRSYAAEKLSVMEHVAADPIHEQLCMHCACHQ